MTTAVPQGSGYASQLCVWFTILFHGSYSAQPLMPRPQSMVLPETPRIQLASQRTHVTRQGLDTFLNHKLSNPFCVLQLLFVFLCTQFYPLVYRTEAQNQI